MDVNALTERWLQGASELKVMTEDRDLLASVIRGWFDGLSQPEEATDLAERVAMYGRALGADGQPASAAVLQGVLLRDVVASADGLPPEASARATELTRILADAHALGSLEREKARARRARQSAAPVLCLKGVGVVGFLAETGDADLVDAVMARILRECAGRGEPRAIVDIGGARREDPLLHRTIAGFTTSTDAERYELVVAGLASRSRTRLALEALGADFSRLTLCESLDTWLSEQDQG